MTPHPPLRASKAVVTWLVAVWAMIFLMVVIGGITRLTESGLSMVEWRPLMGWLPPLTEAEWLDAFTKYQQSPQYLKVNSWMTLSDFQSIFWWEFIHRLLGRVIGVVFLVPWLWFLFKRQLSPRLAKLTFVAFLLGGAQGFLGWFMVASGLVDQPAVSHYRLAAHLSLAFFVAMYVIWLAFGLVAERPDPAGRPAGPPPSRGAVWAFLVLLAVQIAWGAFVAGKRAGLVAMTWPTMNDEWVPSSFLATDPWILDILENPYTVHFLHRMIGYVVLIAGAALWWHAFRRATSPRQRLAAHLIGVGAALQVLLGILTLILHVPIWAAVAHQGGAFLLVTATVLLAHTLRRNRALVPGDAAPASERAAAAAHATP